MSNAARRDAPPGRRYCFSGDRPLAMSKRWISRHKTSRRTASKSVTFYSTRVDIFWLKDESLEDSSKLPDPHVLAAEIAEDLRSALEQTESVLVDLQHRAVAVGREP